MNTTYYHIDSLGNLSIGILDGEQAEYLEIGNTTEAKREAELRAGVSLTWQQQRGELLSTQTTYKIDIDGGEGGDKIIQAATPEAALQAALEWAAAGSWEPGNEYYVRVMDADGEELAREYVTA